ncbi:MAG: tRNA 2-thiouridine(34) synthase MnmA [Helicobacteraceae bacterium]|jgi:tRNA-specific 2-thiouridylase|nr:tRNA 2-thiouridine(34) synthase MnmA [Helicobacteraceae bacterium]
MGNKKRVLLAMSGGVDSSMSSKILLDRGFDVHGVYMKLHEFEAKHKENIRKASKVAAFFGFKFDVLDKRAEFQKEVFDAFIQTYKEGRTPNPCTLCNRIIKFGALLEEADKKECDFMATGHYVRTDNQFFYEAKDKTKDQSYFLFNVKKEVLKRLIFPLSEMEKTDVKKIASGFAEIAELATQRESAEICFVEGDYTEVLQQYFSIDQAGDVLDDSGAVIGSHRGYMQYTIGKRKGFRVDGAKNPLYVKRILPSTNQIVVADKARIYEKEFAVRDLNLFFEPKESEFKAQIKVRYRNDKTPGTVFLDGGEARVVLDNEEFAIAPGQAAVFYESDKLLGGGYIV